MAARSGVGGEKKTSVKKGRFSVWKLPRLWRLHAPPGLEFRSAVWDRVSAQRAERAAPGYLKGRLGPPNSTRNDFAMGHNNRQQHSIATVSKCHRFP